MHFAQTSVLAFLCLFALLVKTESVSTIQILQRTFPAVSACLNWRWIGNCLWSNCDLLGCEVQTSMKVRHYRPDLLVTVQRTSAEIPWNEMRGLLSELQSSTLSSVSRALTSDQFDASGGDVAFSAESARNGDLRFFEANVFGHPLKKIPLEGSELLCRSASLPGKPYYQSTLDTLAWRFAPFESKRPEALVPGQREIGSSFSNAWGSVFPRSGFVTQQSPAKAAAVIAQRACDIVIGPREGRAALGLESPERYTWVPTYLNERDSSTGVWQMISPKIDATCDLFGTNDPHWDIGRIDESRSFIWNLWRPYECCEPRGSIYLGAVYF